MGLSKVLDFPLSRGKEVKSGYSAEIRSGWSGQLHQYNYSEIFKSLGWDDVEVRAGRFKALRLEYRRKIIGTSAPLANFEEEVINQYWYSPDVKYFVKCHYDKDWMKRDTNIFNWELTSFHLKK
jgi:hypothetical protein